MELEAPPWRCFNDPHVLSIMHYNVGTLTDAKMRFVCEQTHVLGLDIVHLLDVGISWARWPGVLRELKRLLGVTHRAWAFGFAEGGVDKVLKSCRIGGQVVMYTNRLTKTSCFPIIKLGAAMGLSFNVGKSQFLSVGTYWPCANTAAGSFQSHIEKVYGGLDAMRTIKAGLDMAVRSGVAAGRSVVLGGDFNCEVGGTSTLVA